MSKAYQKSTQFATSLYDQIVDLDMLAAAWLKVRGNKGAPGIDGVSIARYEPQVFDHLRRLQLRLSRGQYVPSPLRHVKIPKKSGGMRKLSIPIVEDRILQTAIAMVLTPVLDPEMEDSSFAYRPGRSVSQAVTRVRNFHKAGYGWVVDTDIDDYFDNIPHQRLLAKLGQYVDDQRVLGLIETWLEEAGEAGIGVPQGSPLSPLLANIYLDSVDEAIHGSGVRLVRFADDFLLLCKGEKKAKVSLEKIKNILAKEGLALDPEKTRIVTFEEGFRFLGHLFVRSLVLKSDKREGTFTDAQLKAPAKPELLVDATDPDPDDFAKAIAGKIIRQGKSGVRTLYLRSRDCVLKVRNKSFSVMEGPEGAEKEVLAINPAMLGQIELGPAADADLSALKLAALHDIPVVLVDGWGSEIATLSSGIGGRAKLHLAQASLANDSERSVALCKRVLEGKIHNQRALLYRLNRRKKCPETATAAKRIGRLPRKFINMNTVPELMGVEGEAAACYWPALSNMLPKGWHSKKRTRRPPKDPLNLLYSWTADMLYRDFRVLLQAMGVHPGMSFLHAVADNRDSLVLDLMEEFRAPLCEGLVVYLINNRIISLENFGKNSDDSIFIDPEGARRVIRGFQFWLGREVKSPRSGDNVTWRELMAEQGLAYIQHVLEKGEYDPYKMAY